MQRTESVALDCAYFDTWRCRSCTLLATPYDLQLAEQQARIEALLPPMPWDAPHASAVGGFRNKAKMVVSGSADAPVLGILDAAGAGVDLSDCPLYPPALQASFAPLAEFIRLARIEPYDLATRRGELKYLLITLAADAGELMVRFVLRSQEPVQRMRKHLAALQAALAT